MKTEKYFEKLGKAVATLPKDKQKEFINIVQNALFGYILSDLAKIMSKVLTAHNRNSTQGDDKK